MAVFIIKHPYVSEKATRLGAFNQYVFKVFPRANKNEIRKQVEKMFDVKVKAVKVLNMPEKTRNVGKHTGVRTGFKKAIVTLDAPLPNAPVPILKRALSRRDRGSTQRQPRQRGGQYRH